MVLSLTGFAVAQAANQLSDAQPPVAVSAAVQARANAIFGRFNGTPRQRDAGGVLQAHALNGAMDACMDRLGFPGWDWSATRNTAPRTNALGTSVFFSEPMGNEFSNAVMDRSAELKAEQRRLRREISPGEDAAIGDCLASTPATSDDEADSSASLPTAKKLRDAWWSMLTELDIRYGDQRAHDACVQGRGLDVLDGTSLSAAELPQALSSLTPSAENIPPNRDAPSDAEWQRLLDAEDEVEEADWSCRSKVYNDHISDVDAAIQAFAADHAADIAKAEAEWESVVLAAEKLGFTGQTGPLHK